MSEVCGEVHPVEQEWQALTVVAHTHLEVGIRVEHAAQDEAEHDERRLHAEAEARAGQRQAVRPELLDLGHGRVQVDGHVQFGAFGQDGPVLLLVDVGVAVVAVCLPAFEAQLLDAALQLFAGGIGVFGGERGVADEAVGILRYGGGQLVVGVVREPGGPLRLQLLDARGRQRQDGHVDAGGVHGGDTPGADVQQLLEKSVRIGLGGVGLVVEAAVAAHRVVGQLGIAGVGGECVHPTLCGEVDLEVDLLHS